MPAIEDEPLILFSDDDKDGDDGSTACSLFQPSVKDSNLIDLLDGDTFSSSPHLPIENDMLALTLQPNCNSEENEPSSARMPSDQLNASSLPLPLTNDDDQNKPTTTAPAAATIIAPMTPIHGSSKAIDQNTQHTETPANPAFTTPKKTAKISVAAGEVGNISEDDDMTNSKRVTRSAARSNIQNGNTICRRALRFSVDEADNKKNRPVQKPKRTLRLKSWR